VSLADEGKRAKRKPPKRDLRRHFSSGIAVSSHTEARLLIENEPNTIALIRRANQNRSVVFTCPCECGDLIVINVDPAVGPAWRVKFKRDKVSLLPSVWRDSGCGSHFIIWENTVWWFGIGATEEADDLPPSLRRELRTEWARIDSKREA
jgi:hypothetical protein